jgi:N-acetylmuramoyl-L-alanine amidase
VPVVARVLAAGGLVLLLAGCGSSAPQAAPSSPVAAPPVAAPPPTPASAVPASAVPAPAVPASAVPPATVPRPTTAPLAPAAAPSAGRSAPTARRPLVVLDPGHNGGNATHTTAVTRLVDAGNGLRKPCNEVGAESATGYAEHSFNWDVTVRLRGLLAARGLDVRLTRPNDTGVGPCVDMRGRLGNALKADVVVSVHADGGPVGGSGFHVIEAARAPAAEQRLALAVRASMRSGSGLDYADYAAGGDGLDARGDLAGLNLSTRPSVLVEAGNMHNRGDAALQSSAAGRQRIAAAIAAGILAFLGVR